jgi:hypothetical protein
MAMTIRYPRFKGGLEDLRALLPFVPRIGTTLFPWAR